MKKAKSLSAWFKRTGGHRRASRPRFSEPYFEPYAKSIGQLLLAWNDLHERLATLFISAMGGGHIDRPLAIWHRVRNDGGKRELLRAAIENLPEKERAVRPKLAEEILWILDVAQKLEGIRDDSAHGPLHVGYLTILDMASILDSTDIFDSFRPFVAPTTIFQNPRAVRLTKDEDLLQYFKYAIGRTLVLRDYAMAIDDAWSNVKFPWPDRPVLPDRKPSRRLKAEAPRRKQK